MFIPELVILKVNNNEKINLHLLTLQSDLGLGQKCQKV